MGSIIEQSSWSDKVYLIELSDPVQGGEDGINNLQAKQLANRTRFFRDSIFADHNSDGTHGILNDDLADALLLDESKLSLDVSLSELLAKIQSAEENTDALENSDSSQSTILDRQDTFRRQVSITNLSDREKYYYELFRNPFSLSSTFLVTGVTAVSGDNSIDCDDTSKIAVGSDYVVVSGDTRIPVTVDGVLSTTRFTITQTMPSDIPDGTLQSSTVSNDGDKTRFVSGDIYYAGPLQMDNDGIPNHLVIRRADVPGKFQYFYKEVGDSQWTVAERVSSASHVVGTRDEVYKLGNGATTFVRIQADEDIDPVDFKYICVYCQPSLESFSDVMQPYNVSPASGDVNIGETPALNGSTYGHIYGLPQASAEFRIAHDEAMSYIVYEATENLATTQHVVASGNLSVDTVYFWQVRYKDSNGVTSRWSLPTSFSTGSTFEYVKQPECLSPTNNAEGIQESPLLESSTFSVVNTSDTHEATRWIVALDADLSTVVWDSGYDTTNLESVQVPGGVLQESNTYYWAVKHIGLGLGESQWSAPNVFVCANTFYVGFATSISRSGSDETFTDSTYDADGNIYSCGMAVISGIDRSYVAKFDKDGNVLWKRYYGYGTRDSKFEGVALDSAGFLYAVGGDSYFHSGGYQYSRGYLLKLDPDNGTTVWGRVIDNEGTQYGVYFHGGIAVDANDDLYIGGRTDSEGPYPDRADHDYLLMKYRSSGELVWKSTHQGNDKKYHLDVGVLGNGAVICVGMDTPTYQGDGRATVARYDPATGDILWQKSLGSNTILTKIVSTPSSDFIAVGVQGVNDTLYPFVVKISDSGSILWQRKLSIPGVWAYGVTLDNSGNIYVSSNQQITKLDSSGYVQWSYALNSSLGNVDVNDVKYINSTKLVLVGEVYNSNTNDDPFLTTIDPSKDIPLEALPSPFSHLNWGEGTVNSSVTEHSWGNISYSKYASNVTQSIVDFSYALETGAQKYTLY